MRLTRISLQALIIVCYAALPACMVGPDFRSPRAPQTDHYTYGKLPKKTTAIPSTGKSGKSQHFNYGQDIPANWWVLYHSKELNQLVEAGLKNSPTLEAAKATLRQAQENLRAQWGTLLLPSANLQTGYQRTRFSAQQFGSPVTNLFNLWTAQVNVAYNVDVFGGYRRQVETYRALVDYQGYELLAAQVTLTSNIATTAINIASLKAQIKAVRYLIHLSSNQLDIMRKQFALGGLSKVDVLTQETFVEQTKATLPPLEQNLAKSQHALAVLIGCLPSESHLPDIKLENLSLPQELPLSIPSNLIKQRPDVQAADALLHQATAQIGVATANLLPSFPISANYGYQSDKLNDLFTAFRNVWSYGINPTQILFQGGALFAQRRAAIAAADAALAQYRQTVLQAFQNVADSLRAIENDAKELKAQNQAELAASKTLDLTDQQFKLGAVNYILLLNAQQTYQQTVINRIQAEAARYTDTAALFQALGGGWWNCGGRCEA